MNTLSVKAMDEANVRFDHMVWIPGAGLTEDGIASEAFGEFVSDIPLDPAAKLYAELPLLQRFALDGTDPDAVDVAVALGDVEGFLVLMSTPKRRFYKDGSGYTATWNRTHHRWAYVKSAGDFVTVAQSFSKDCYEMDLAATKSSPALIAA